MGGKDDRAAHTKLVELIGLALQSEDANLRDAAISYIALADLAEGKELIANHLEREKIAWLKEYAERVMRHVGRPQGRTTQAPGGPRRSIPDRSLPPDPAFFQKIVDIFGSK